MVGSVIRAANSETTQHLYEKRCPFGRAIRAPGSEICQENGNLFATTRAIFKSEMSVFVIQAPSSKLHKSGDNRKPMVAKAYTIME